MTNSRLVIVASPAAYFIGKKVINEINTLLETRYNEVKNENRELEKRNIEELWELNKEQRNGKKEVCLSPIEVVYFANGEFKIVEGESVRDTDAFILSQVYNPEITSLEIMRELIYIYNLNGKRKNYNSPLDIDEKTIQAFIKKEYSPAHNTIITDYILSALKNAPPRYISLIEPCLGDQRQDKRQTREGLHAKDHIRGYENAGATNKILAFQLHNQAIVGFGKEVTIDNVFPTRILLEKFKELNPNYLDEFIILAPDTGAAQETDITANKLIIDGRPRIPMGLTIKLRDPFMPNKILKTQIICNEIRDKLLIRDDMIDTAGTLCEVIKAYKKLNPNLKKVVVITTHPVFSPPALERLSNLYKEGLLHELIITDSICRTPEFYENYPFIHEVSIAGMIAKAIYNLHFGYSLKDVYSFEA
ncbi:MAG: ribose-phosphate diphosphokinase [Candidatus Micrarchaeia archaeon]|jgi:ribose-phosphate pyrophosphokinase